jgi:hypothetical protein
MEAPDLPAALIPITHQLRAYFQQTYPDRLDRPVMFGSRARGCSINLPSGAIACALFEGLRIGNE